MHNGAAQQPGSFHAGALKVDSVATLREGRPTVLLVSSAWSTTGNGELHINICSLPDHAPACVLDQASFSVACDVLMSQAGDSQSLPASLSRLPDNCWNAAAGISFSTARYHGQLQRLVCMCCHTCCKTHGPPLLGQTCC